MKTTLPQKILVTGGAGFIGSHLVRELVRQNKTVGVIDNLSRGSLAKIADVQADIDFYELDLEQNTDQLQAVFAKYELVFNLAALNTGIDYDEGRTQQMFEHNMLLQLIPLQVAGQTPSIKKFIQVSTASVYSRKAMEEQVPTPETADTTDPEPSKLGYALAKKMGENLAQWYSQTKENPLHTVVARFINVYGEDDHFDDLGHFIPMMTRKILQAQGEVEVFGSGKQKRSFMHVADAVSGLLTLAHRGENGNVYNIDSQEEKSVSTVVKMIADELGKDVQFKFDKNKPEGSQRRLLDNQKIKKLGWQPKMSFTEGLQKTVANIAQRVQK